MGRLTRDELLTAGLGKMGNLSSALNTRIATEFQAWLDRQYAGWSWPFLKKRASGISLSQGATSLTVGAGNGGITREIIKLISPLGYYTSNKSTIGKAPIVQSSNSASTFWDETLSNSSTFIGSPTQFKARHGSVRGSWDLIALPFPDQALLLAIDYYELPALLTGADVPIYPADATMIEAINALALVDQKGMDHPATQTAMEEAGAKIARDRSTYGSVPGENDMLLLDSSVFR